MLDQDDKKWIQEILKTSLAEQEERFDTKLEKRFAEQEERFDIKLANQREELQKLIDERFMEQNRQLNMTIDIRHNDILRKIDDRFKEMKADNDRQFRRMLQVMDKRFDEQDRHINSVFKNEIMPKIELFLEIIPGFNQSYKKLEERVTKLERDQDVIKSTIKSRMQIG